jgi:DNA-binding MarR family transcriptional regulator
MCCVLYASCTLDGVDDSERLVGLSRLVLDTYTGVSERHGLTAVQARLLCTLTAGARGMAELAQCFGVEKAALTGLVDRAERRGLVRREAVPDDRRVTRVALTAAGEQAAVAFHAAADEAVRRLLAPLAPDDRCVLHSLLDKVLGPDGRGAGTPGPDQPAR